MFQVAVGLELCANNQDCATEKFQEAILTTDTRQKASAYQEEIDIKTITVAGCTKGSGVISKLNSAKYALLYGVKNVNINNNIHCLGTKITT